MGVIKGSLQKHLKTGGGVVDEEGVAVKDA